MARTRNSATAATMVAAGRSAAYHNSGAWAKKHAPKKAAAKAAAVKKTTPRVYPATSVKTPLRSIRAQNKAQKQRSSLKPGAVLILLAGCVSFRSMADLHRSPTASTCRRAAGESGAGRCTVVCTVSGPEGGGAARAAYSRPARRRAPAPTAPRPAHATALTLPPTARTAAAAWSC